MMYKDLDPILHSQLRLAVISILVSVEKGEFSSDNLRHHEIGGRTICSLC